MGVTVTYHAPEGDSPVVETRGLRLFDGQALAVDEDENAEFIAKAEGNPHFEVIGVKKKPVSAENMSAHDYDAMHDALVAEATGLGIRVDGRWSTARLESEISTAKSVAKL